MSSKKKFVGYIGRFSLWHNGHAAVALRALQRYENVHILIGSADQPRTIKNPWTAQERAEVIQAWYEKEFARDSSLGKLTFGFHRDYRYNNNKWFANIHEMLQAKATEVEIGDEPIWITGAKRDHSSFYLDEFPRPAFELDLVKEDSNISAALSASWCREIYLGRSWNGRELDRTMYETFMKAVVPSTTMMYLDKFEKTDAYEYLREAYSVINRRQGEMMTHYGVAPALTADAVVLQSGYILLIRRRSHPGKGLWALPGGHVNANEWTLDAALRELDEESKIDCPKKIIRSSLKFSEWFEAPDRSNVARVITQAFCFTLPDHKVDGRVTLPSVRGTDDADRAQWFPIHEALKMSDSLFDDHYDIITNFIDRLRANKVE